MAGTTTYFGISYPQSTDLVKDGAANMQTIATGFDSAVAIPTYNAQTGTTYTFALSDIGKTVTASNAGASTYTIPPQASVVWPTGTTLEITNLGAGVVTFAAGAGVTVTNAAATLSQYGSAALIRTGSNTWTVTPRSGGASGLNLVKTQTIGSAVSSVTVTDAFSATYDNYLVTIGGGVGSTSLRMSLKIGNATTAYYNMVMYLQYSLSGSIQGIPGNNVGDLDYIGYATPNGINANILINSPFLSKYTTVEAAAIAESVSNGNIATKTVGALANTNSYTSFIITPVGATLTGGTIRVYGYQNS